MTAPGLGAAVAVTFAGATVALSPARRCAVCGASLDGRRSDARHCTDACRVEGWRIARLLAGREAGRYATLAERLAAYGRARNSRTQAR